MAKEYVPVFFDWLDVTQDLTAEEKGNLIDAVVAYASGKEYEHLLTGGCRIAFRFLKGQVDRNNAISEARINARSNKHEQNETNNNKPEQNETNDNKTEQNVSNFPKEKEKDKDKDKENDKEKDKKENRRFSPPTPEEVAAYCRERGNTVNADRFCDFYSSKGWKVGNQPMKDWKAAVRTWEQTENKPPAVRNIIPAQDYHQRDYTDAQEAAFERMMEMGGIA